MHSSELLLLAAKHQTIRLHVASRGPAYFHEDRSGARVNLD
jgi:hypothetical protein